MRGEYRHCGIWVCLSFLPDLCAVEKGREEGDGWVEGVLTGWRVECSAKRNRGVNEAFTEAARVALSVKGGNGGGSGADKCVVM